MGRGHNDWCTEFRVRFKVGVGQFTNRHKGVDKRHQMMYDTYMETKLPPEIFSNNQCTQH